MNGHRTALVTGASRGIGAAIAHVLSDNGCKVLMPPRDRLDLLSDKSIDDYLTSLHLDVDILVNNAGINQIAELSDIKDQDLQEILQVNVLAPLRLARGVAAGMKERRYGRIVNISSIWSLVSRNGRTSYAISKNALNGMTRALAVELAPSNVLINSVAPGYVMTDLTRQNNLPAELQKIGESIPLQRLAEPEEIANVVAFLCSDQNTYLTGQVIIVDGGYTCL